MRIFTDISAGMPHLEDPLRKQRIDCFGNIISILPWFNTDILHKLYINVFQEVKEALDIHRRTNVALDEYKIRSITCADFIHSPQVKRIDLNVFEIKPEIKNKLRKELDKDLLNKVAEFMLMYVKSCPEHILTFKYKEALRVEANFILNPKSEAKRIVDHIAEQASREFMEHSKVEESIKFYLNIIRSKQADNQLSAAFKNLERLANQDYSNLELAPSKAQNSFKIALPQDVKNEILKQINQATPQEPPLETRDPKLFSIIIGIDQYDFDNIFPLRSAVSDAKRMHNYVGFQTFTRDPFIFLNDSANKKDILLAFQKIKEEAIDGDSLFFYFAGYGGLEDHEGDFEERAFILFNHMENEVKSRLSLKEIYFAFVRMLEVDIKIQAVFDTAFSTLRQRIDQKLYYRNLAELVPARPIQDTLYFNQDFELDELYQKTYFELIAGKDKGLAMESKDGGNLTSALLEYISKDDENLKLDKLKAYLISYSKEIGQEFAIQSSSKSPQTFLFENYLKSHKLSLKEVNHMMTDNKIDELNQLIYNNINLFDNPASIYSIIYNYQKNLMLYRNRKIGPEGFLKEVDKYNELLIAQLKQLKNQDVSFKRKSARDLADPFLKPFILLDLPSIRNFNVNNFNINFKEYDASSISELASSFEKEWESVIYTEKVNIEKDLLQLDDMFNQLLEFRFAEGADRLPEKWILVTGTGTKKEFEADPKLRQSAIEVAKQIKENNFGLITSGWPYVDESVANIFVELLEDEKLNTQHYFKIVSADNVFLGNAMKDHAEVIQLERSSFEEATKRILSYADAVIIIGGSVNVRKTAELAMEQSLPIFPIGNSGGEAEKISKDPSYESYILNISNSEFRAIETEGSTESVTKNIFKALSDITFNKLEKDWMDYAESIVSNMVLIKKQGVYSSVGAEAPKEDAYSGVLINDKFLLTSNAAISSEKDAEMVHVTSQGDKPIPINLNPNSFFTTSEDLAYSIIAIERLNDLQNLQDPNFFSGDTLGEKQEVGMIMLSDLEFGIPVISGVKIEVVEADFIHVDYQELAVEKGGLIINTNHEILALTNGVASNKTKPGRFIKCTRIDKILENLKDNGLYETVFEEKSFES